MSKVLFVYERMISTVAIAENCFSSTEYRNLGMDVSFMPAEAVRSRNITESDVIVLIRPENLLSVSILNRAKESGCFVAVLCDDDLLNKSDSVPDIPWRTESLRKSIENCDVFLTSSPFLCRKYLPLTKSGRVAFLNTAIPSGSIYEPQEHAGNEVRILYAAGASHEALFTRHVLPVLSELLNRVDCRISLTFMGVHPNVGELNEKIHVRYIPPMPLLEFRREMAEGAYDIGLAPLNTDEFSKCKYFNKFMEYTQAGIPGIYTKVEPYTFVVKDGINGVLAENTFESWLKKLTEMIGDTELRRKCIVNAQRLLVEDFNPETIASRLLNDIPEFQTYSGKRAHCSSLFLPRIVYKIVRLFDICFLTVFYLRREGISGFGTKVRSHREHRNSLRK